MSKSRWFHIEFIYKRLTIKALIFALFVYIVKVLHHLDHGDMRSSIVDYSFGTIFDEILQQDKGLRRRVLSNMAIHRGGERLPCKFVSIV